MSFAYTGSTTPALFVRGAIEGHQLRDSVAQTNVALGYIDDATDHQVNVTPAIIGDANLYGTVGSDDFDILAAHSGASDAAVSWANGDFNHDGTVNALDFNALASNFGQTLSSAAPADSLNAIIPEPCHDLFPLALYLIEPRRMRKALPHD